MQVFSVYQSIEALKLGWECEAHQGYHINADHYPARIVEAEGHDAPPGEMGEVVISNLVNRGMVLLNYRIGDWARRIEEPCPCGRTLPRISFVDGRIVDSLLALDGHRVPCTLLDRAIRPHPGVWQWQAVQEARDRLSIALRVAASCEREALEQAVVSAVRGGLGEGMAVELRFVDKITRTPAGKMRYVINEVEARP
jgi:phenylacetate-CoA ligase